MNFIESIKKNHPVVTNWLVALFLFVVTWVLASLIAYCVVLTGRGYWLELFNGATWPPQFVTGHPSNDIEPIRSAWFFAVLGFRTAVNLGIVLTAAFVLIGFYFFSTHRLEQWIMSKLESVLSTRDQAFATFVVSRMKAAGDALTQQQRDNLYKAADEFDSSEAGRAFLQSTIHAALHAATSAREARRD